MQEEWVVGLSRRLGHRQGRRMGKAIVRTDEEAVEIVAGVDRHRVRRCACRVGARAGAARRIDERDSLELGRQTAQSILERPYVPALDPGANALRAGQIEGLGRSADGAQWLDPEIERRRG